MLELFDKLFPLVLTSCLFSLVSFLKKNKEKKGLAILLILILTVYWILVALISYLALLAAQDQAIKGESGLGLYILSLYLAVCVLVKCRSVLVERGKKKKPPE